MGRRVRRPREGGDGQEGDAVRSNFRPLAPRGVGRAGRRGLEADGRRVHELPGLTDEQQAAATDALHHRRQQLADYLATEETSIADWQHELSRLEEWEDGADATNLPFQVARDYRQENRNRRRQPRRGSPRCANWKPGSATTSAACSRPSRRRTPSSSTQSYDALGDAKERKLHRINVAVTCLLIGVGACLLLGLFTRLAALGGIAFLADGHRDAAAVGCRRRSHVLYTNLSKSPPWSCCWSRGAGRWAGLDFFLRAHCARKRACGRHGARPQS